MKLKHFSEKEQKDIYVPYEYYHPDIKAVLINIPGSWIDGEVYLFDIPQQKDFQVYQWESNAILNHLRII